MSICVATIYSVAAPRKRLLGSQAATAQKHGKCCVFLGAARLSGCLLLTQLLTVLSDVLLMLGFGVREMQLAVVAGDKVQVIPCSGMCYCIE